MLDLNAPQTATRHHEGAISLMQRSLKEYATKGAHLILRELNLQPEQFSSRTLKKWSLSGSSSEYPDLHGQKILIWSMRDWSIHVQMETLLGQVLRAHGAEVVMGTCGGGLEICDRVNTWEGPPMPCRSCTKYVSNSLKSHGLTSERLADGWGNESFWPELDLLNLEELREVEWGGLPLGKLVDIPVKWFLMGESLSEDPLGTLTYRKFLRSARKIAASARSIIDTNQPEQVVLLNGLFLFESIIIEICRERNISFITYERALMLDTFVFKRNGIAGFYRVDEDWDHFSAIPLSPNERVELHEHFTARQTGGGVSDNYWGAISSASEYSSSGATRAVLFTNLVWDSAVIGQDLAFDSIVDWIVASVEEFDRRPSCELIIRVHPAEVKLSGRESRERMEDALRQRIPSLPDNIRLISPEDSVSSYELMESADFGLVYTSTTGLEMALRGKPVIVAGKTHYRDRGFTVDVNNRNEFVSAIESQVDPSTRFTPNVDLAERYAHLLFFKSAYSDFGLTEPIRGLCKIDPSRVIEATADPSNDLHKIITTIAARSDFRVSQ